jgi:hypothetical protein
VPVDRLQRLEQAIARVADLQEEFVALTELSGTAPDMAEFLRVYSDLQLATNELKNALEDWPSNEEGAASE